jgi:hypothetical protein
MLPGNHLGDRIERWVDFDVTVAAVRCGREDSACDNTRGEVEILL